MLQLVNAKRGLGLLDSRSGSAAVRRKPMDTNEATTYWDKLRLRAIEVERTIKHLKKERQEAEENNEWAERAAYESRVNPLDGLISLYHHEIKQIEKAHSGEEERS